MRSWSHPAHYNSIPSSSPVIRAALTHASCHTSTSTTTTCENPGETDQFSHNTSLQYSSITSWYPVTRLLIMLLSQSTLYSVLPANSNDNNTTHCMVQSSAAPELTYEWWGGILLNIVIIQTWFSQLETTAPGRGDLLCGECKHLYTGDNWWMEKAWCQGLIQ